MSDNSNDGKVSYPGKEQTPNDSAAANPEGTANQDGGAEESQEGPITRKEVLNLLKESNSQTYRQIQSLTDRLATNFGSALTEKLSNFNQNLEVMKAAGVNLEESDIAKTREKIMDDTLAASGQSESDPQNADELNQQGKQSEMPSGVMDQMLKKIDDQLGVSVMQDDPEAKMVKMDDPLMFIDTYKAAAEAKSKRLGTPAEARLTTMATGANPSQDIEALTDRLAELQKDPRNTKEERMKIRKQISELEGNK